MADTWYAVRCPATVQRITEFQTRQLQVQQVGDTKVVRMYLLNAHEVAQDCGVPMRTLGNHIGFNLNARIVFNPTRPQREQLYIQGRLTLQEISDAFARFLVEYM